MATKAGGEALIPTHRPGFTTSRRPDEDVWTRLRPDRTFWTDDPGDPDFTLRYRVLTDDALRVRPSRACRLAIHLAGKTLAVTRARGTHPDEDILTVTLGLTMVHRLADNRLNHCLERLIVVERRRA